MIQCITASNETCSDGFNMNKWIWVPICMLLYIPLVMVRKIEVFAVTHVFADAMIIISVLTIFIYAGIDLAQDGPNMSEIGPVGEYWADAIGFSVYTYEGIGVILPIREVTAD